MIKIKLVLIFLLLVVAFVFLFPDKINPDLSPLYSLKRFQEKIYLNLKKSPSDKALYQEELLDRRAKELKYITDSRNYDLLLSSSLRYSTTAGELEKLIEDNKLKNRIDEAENEFANHKFLFQKLLNNYPKSDYNKEWKYLEDDINYLNIYNQKLINLR